MPGPHVREVGPKQVQLRLFHCMLTLIRPREWSSQGLGVTEEGPEEVAEVQRSWTPNASTS